MILFLASYKIHLTIKLSLENNLLPGQLPKCNPPEIPFDPASFEIVKTFGQNKDPGL